MAVARKITDFDIVELTEPAYDAPAGAREACWRYAKTALP